METTEQTNTQRARALIQELRKLTGARAIVFWTAEDVIADCPHMTLADADSWLEQHEEDIQEAMCREGWEYMAEFLPTNQEEE